MFRIFHFILQTGQYLMMLPQQLEAFSLETSASMRTALKLGKLPFATDRGAFKCLKNVT